MQVERLEEVVVGTLLHRLDGRIRRLGQGDEDHRDPRVDLADLLVDLQAGLVGQAQVEQNDIGRLGADALEPFGAGAGHFDAVTGSGKRLAHLLGDQDGVIVDEQQVGHGRLRHGMPGEEKTTQSLSGAGSACPAGRDHGSTFQQVTGVRSQYSSNPDDSVTAALQGLRGDGMTNTTHPIDRLQRRRAGPGGFALGPLASLAGAGGHSPAHDVLSGRHDCGVLWRLLARTAGDGLDAPSPRTISSPGNCPPSTSRA